MKNGIIVCVSNNLKYERKNWNSWIFFLLQPLYLSMQVGKVENICVVMFVVLR